MRNGAISGEARLLAAVSELDASPAPATEIAADRLVAVVGALVPGDLSKVWLGDERAFFDVQHRIEGRRIADVPLWSSSVRDHEHLVVAFHDSTGLLTTGRRSDVGSLRSRRPAIDYRRHDPRLVLTPAARVFWLPFGLENMLRAPVGFPNEHAHLASYRAGCDFSDGDIRLLDQLRPVASRLLRRAVVSSLAEASASAWGLAPREAEVFAFAGVGLSLSLDRVDRSGSRWGRSVPTWARPTRRQPCGPVPLPRPRSSTWSRPPSRKPAVGSCPVRGTADTAGDRGAPHRCHGSDDIRHRIGHRDLDGDGQDAPGERVSEARGAEPVAGAALGGDRQGASRWLGADRPRKAVETRSDTDASLLGVVYDVRTVISRSSMSDLPIIISPMDPTDGHGSVGPSPAPGPGAQGHGLGPRRHVPDGFR